jgi:hypothetical protein
LCRGTCYLKNFIVEEWKILNGYIGTVVDIIYDNPLGPREQDLMSSYVVVDIKNWSVPEDMLLFLLLLNDVKKDAVSYPLSPCMYA